MTFILSLPSGSFGDAHLNSGNLGVRPRNSYRRRVPWVFTVLSLGQQAKPNTLGG